LSRNSTRRQVQDVGLADQRHDEQDGYAIHLVGLRVVVVELECAALVDDVLRGQPDGRVARGNVFEALDASLNGPLDLSADALFDRKLGGRSGHMLSLNRKRARIIPRRAVGVREACHVQGGRFG
jgi:hypothetical protein